MPMLTICYTENKEQRFDHAPSKEEFEKRHPNAVIQHMYDNGSDLFRLSAEYEKGFLENYEKYNMRKKDLHRKFTSADGEEYMILGLKTRKKRYKCITRNMTTNIIYCMTPYSVLKQISRNIIEERKTKENPGIRYTIWNKDSGLPLRWDNCLLFFSTPTDAEVFINSFMDNGMKQKIRIKSHKLPDDDEYLNGDKLIVRVAELPPSGRNRGWNCDDVLDIL